MIIEPQLKTILEKEAQKAASLSDDNRLSRILITAKVNIPGLVNRFLRAIGGRIVDRIFDRLYLAEAPPVELLKSSASGISAFNPNAEYELPAPLSSKNVSASLAQSVAMMKSYNGITFPEYMPETRVPVNGEGAAVIVMDTGVSSKLEAFGGRVIIERNFSSDNDFHDGDGHGTHCAGIAAGNPKDSPFRGVAWGANIWNVKVLNSSGVGTLVSILRGMQFTANEVEKRTGFHILSMSLGARSHFCKGDCPLCQAAKALYKKGILIVAAAGNDGPGKRTIKCPGRSDGVICVGAVDKCKQIAPFSSRGPRPDGKVLPHVVAPGVDITSFVPGGSYRSYSGTSMAAPHAAGAAALLYQWETAKGRGNVEPGQVRKMLLRAEDLQFDENEQGKGFINLVKAAGLSRASESPGRKKRMFSLGGRNEICVNHPMKPFWTGWPAKTKTCVKCGKTLCPGCYRKDRTCHHCKNQKMKTAG